MLFKIYVVADFLTSLQQEQGGCYLIIAGWRYKSRLLMRPILKTQGRMLLTTGSESGNSRSPHVLY